MYQIFTTLICVYYKKNLQYLRIIYNKSERIRNPDTNNYRNFFGSVKN